MCICAYMYVCIHVHVCMHDDTDGKGYFLKNPVLSTLLSSRTRIRCGTYPVIVNGKPLLDYI